MYDEKGIFTYTDEDQRADRAFRVGTNFGVDKEKTRWKQALELYLEETESYGDDIEQDDIRRWIEEQ